MGRVTKDDGWRLSDEVWTQIEPLLPPRNLHPLGCPNPRVSDRDAMNAIWFGLRTGCPWNALDASGLCFVRFGQSALPGRNRGEGVRSVLARRADRIRWAQGDRLVVAIAGGSHVEGTACGFKKPGRIRRTGASRASSAAC